MLRTSKGSTKASRSHYHTANIAGGPDHHTGGPNRHIEGSDHHSGGPDHHSMDASVDPLYIGVTWVRRGLWGQISYKRLRTGSELHDDTLSQPILDSGVMLILGDET